MASIKIAVIKGDGIGPEIVDEALNVLKAIAPKYQLNFEFTEVLAGGAALDAVGEPLPKSTMDACLASDAVFLGAVGGPKWDSNPSNLKPEKALLGLRSGLGLFANLRPAKVYPMLVSASTLKPEVVSGTDIVIIRELTGGVYFGQPKGFSGSKEKGDRKGFNTMAYTEEEIRRIAKVGFETARRRTRKLCSVDKANVLEVSQLWREVVIEVSKDYPDVELSHMYVDNAAMQLIRWPKQFDTIVTSNLFGDVLSDEAAMLTGSIGMLPSASMGATKRGMYEPIHGSAPDIAGKGIANPIATILSAAMMLEYSLDLKEPAQQIEKAVTKVLEQGYRTADIMSEGMKKVFTTEMGALILKNL